MKIQVRKVHTFISNLKNSKLIVLFVFVNLLLARSFSFLSRIFNKKEISEGFDGFSSISQEILFGIILAPIVETFIFQFLIIETLKNKLAPLYVCFVSALIFGLTHSYNLFYFLFGLFGGLTFAYLYYLGKSKIRGFLLVLITHALYNSFVFTILHL